MENKIQAKNYNDLNRKMIMKVDNQIVSRKRHCHGHHSFRLQKVFFSSNLLIATNSTVFKTKKIKLSLNMQTFNNPVGWVYDHAVKD